MELSSAEEPTKPKPAHRYKNTDFVKRLSEDVVRQVFGYVDFRTKVKLENVATHWRNAIKETYTSNMKEVWIYTIFRRGQTTMHKEMMVKLSYHGPIFWERQVIYIYICSCHFDQHETEFQSLCRKVGPQVDRVCLVDSPLMYPYLTDEFYRFILDSMPNLKWLYIREMDLEPVSFNLVHAAVNHPALKKIIVHWCRNYKTLTDFEVLRSRLLVCSTDIKGLRYIDDIDKQLDDMRIEDAQEEADKMEKKYERSASIRNNFGELGDTTEFHRVKETPARAKVMIDSGIEIAVNGKDEDNNVVGYSQANGSLE